MGELLAQAVPTITPGAVGLTIGGQTLSNPLLNPNIRTIGDVVNLILPFLYGIAGIILFFVILWGGFNILLSGGESEKLESGRMQITSGIIGFVLLAVSFLLARLVTYIFGLGNGII